MSFNHQNIWKIITTIITIIIIVLVRTIYKVRNCDVSWFGGSSDFIQLLALIKICEDIEKVFTHLGSFTEI